MLDETNQSPSSGLIRRETEHLVSCFCTFVSLCKGKKLSLQNIFLIVLQEPKMRSILKRSLSIDSDQEVVQLFIDHDPTILKSKYVTKYINSSRYSSPIVQ